MRTRNRKSSGLEELAQMVHVLGGLNQLGDTSDIAQLAQLSMQGERQQHDIKSDAERNELYRAKNEVDRQANNDRTRSALAALALRQQAEQRLAKQMAFNESMARTRLHNSSIMDNSMLAYRQALMERNRAETMGELQSQQLLQSILSGKGFGGAGAGGGPAANISPEQQQQLQALLSRYQSQQPKQ